MTAIRLSRAMFCLDCQLVIDGWARCPQCGTSESLMPLARWVKPVESVVAALDQISAVRARGEKP
jgi:hypothetical protein